MASIVSYKLSEPQNVAFCVGVTQEECDPQLFLETTGQSSEI
jgi:hypothetical protein